MTTLSAGRAGAVLLILARLAFPAPAEGSTGLAFLKTGVDARSTILGEAVTSSVGDASSCFWNPAGLAQVRSPQLMLSHIESFADLRHEYAAAAQPLGVVTVGLFFNGLWTDDLDRYSAAAEPEGSFGFATYAAGVALGAPGPWHLRLGGTLKYLQESIDVYDATGWAVDLGLQWAPPDRLPLEFGLAVLNLGPSLSFIEDSFDLPLTVQGGASWEIPLESVTGRLLLGADLRHVKDQGTVTLFGAEYDYRDLLRFGVGYQGGQDTRDVSAGLGVHQGRLAVDWAYVPISEDLGEEHRFSLRLDL